MQPAAAEIERQPFPLDGPCSPADPRARFKHVEVRSRLREPPPRGDAGRTRADDDDIDFGFQRRGIHGRSAPGFMTSKTKKGRQSAAPFFAVGTCRVTPRR